MKLFVLGEAILKSEITKFKDLKISYIDGDDELLVNLYNNAISLILPSKYEGFGIPMLEAMELSCQFYPHQQKH